MNTKKVIHVPYGKELSKDKSKIFDLMHPLKQVEEVIKYFKENESFEVYTSSPFVIETFDIISMESEDIEFWMYQSGDNNEDIKVSELCIIYREISGKAYDILDSIKCDTYFKGV